MVLSTKIVPLSGLQLYLKAKFLYISVAISLRPKILYFHDFYQYFCLTNLKSLGKKWSFFGNDRGRGRQKFENFSIFAKFLANSLNSEQANHNFCIFYQTNKCSSAIPLKMCPKFYKIMSNCSEISFLQEISVRKVRFLLFLYIIYNDFCRFPDFSLCLLIST